MNLNKALIIGRVTAQPELRKTPGGQSVTTFSIATNRSFADKSGARQEETEFHTVVVWGRQAEIASQFMVKGSLVFVEGRLKTRTWQDKQGTSHKVTEIICDRFQLGPKPQGAGGGSSFGGGSAPRASNAFPASGSRTGGVAPASPAAAQVAHEDIPVINVEEEGAGEIPQEEVPF